MTEITIVRAEQTCESCPSQWDAWTDDWQYLYLRFRCGRGTVDAYDDPDPDTWGRVPDGVVARFEHGGPLDGVISLESFCRLAGLRLELIR
ncbi:hypothetical protein [Streptomyces atriruber]|uniref:hypothetical protein n=1 Tax=Streptomyces atriruber TaxID=545121 RepID=UPI0006E20F2F|nr:hypothetical protein [Streptomyces atriruber]